MCCVWDKFSVYSTYFYDWTLQGSFFTIYFSAKLVTFNLFLGKLQHKYNNFLTEWVMHILQTLSVKTMLIAQWMDIKNQKDYSIVDFIVMCCIRHSVYFIILYKNRIEISWPIIIS